MLGIYSGWSEMVWQMNHLPLGEGMSLKCSKNNLKVHLILYPSKNCVKNSIFKWLRVIWGLHLPLISTQIWNFRDLYLSECWKFFIYFCLGILGTDESPSPQKWDLGSGWQLTRWSLHPIPQKQKTSNL